MTTSVGDKLSDLFCSVVTEVLDLDSSAVSEEPESVSVGFFCFSYRN